MSDGIIHPGAAANEALGAYMTAWSNVEHQVGRVFTTITGTDAMRAWHLRINASTRDLIEAAKGLLGFLPPDVQRVGERLLERARRASLKRNKIVHANWAPVGDEFVRLYQGLTIWEIARALSTKPEDQSFRDANYFPVSRLKRLAHDLTPLAEGLARFHEQIQPLMKQHLEAEWLWRAEYESRRALADALQQVHPEGHPPPPESEPR